MKTIVNILIKRDGLSRDEAQEKTQEVVDHCRDILAHDEDHVCSYSMMEEHIRDELGLEPDYLHDILEAL